MKDMCIENEILNRSTVLLNFHETFKNFNINKISLHCNFRFASVKTRNVNVQTVPLFNFEHGRFQFSILFEKHLKKNYIVLV